MDFRSSLVSGLESTRKLLYRGPVKGTVRALGLETRLRTVYSRVLGGVSEEDIVSHEIAEVSTAFRVSSGLEVQRFRNLMAEEEVIESLLRDVRANDVFYDVGANVGLYTCFLSQVVAQTVSFEPHPVNLQRLEENVELNDLSNVIVRPEALSDVDGTAELAVTGASVAGEGTHSLATGSEHRSVQIETVRGDALADQIPKPNVIKIDVEGAELNVLQGMENSLAGCRVCYVEVHPDRIGKYGGSADDVKTLLSEQGFDVEEIFEREGEEYFLKAQRQSGKA